MLKILLTLVFTMLIAVALLQLRHQRLELNYQTNKLHDEIRQSQAKLWNQQLQIAIYTAPNAISKTVGDENLNMVPASPLPGDQTHWIDPKRNPDAE
jgi:cell division protein FtsL